MCLGKVVYLETDFLAPNARKGRPSFKDVKEMYEHEFRKQLEGKSTTVLSKDGRHPTAKG
jgi:hypothetical protein